MCSNKRNLCLPAANVAWSDSAEDILLQINIYILTVPFGQKAVAVEFKGIAGARLNPVAAFAWNGILIAIHADGRACPVSVGANRVSI